MVAELSWSLARSKKANLQDHPCMILEKYLATGHFKINGLFLIFCLILPAA